VQEDAVRLAGLKEEAMEEGLDDMQALQTRRAIDKIQGFIRALSMRLGEVQRLQQEFVSLCLCLDTTPPLGRQGSGSVDAPAGPSTAAQDAGSSDAPAAGVENDSDSEGEGHVQVQDIGSACNDHPDSDVEDGLLGVEDLERRWAFAVGQLPQ